MRVLQWIEAVSGVLASIAGGAAIAFLLTAPSYSSASCQVSSSGGPPICVTTTRTLVQVNGSAAIVDLSIVAIVLLGVFGAVIWHSLTGQIVPLVMLCIFTAALTIFTLLALLSIGILLLPSMALALVASVCALIWSLVLPQPRNHRADGMTPRHA